METMTSTWQHANVPMTSKTDSARMPNGSVKETPMTTFSEAYAGKRVLITGLTGFRGRWLGEWLRILGAKVYGFGQTPLSSPSGDLPDFNDRFQDLKRIDIRSREHVSRYVREVEPEMVFHLASRTQVRNSYLNPSETFETNILGLIHVLDSVRECDSVRAIVNVTSNKCYENRDWDWAYRETDPLGGHDPYSASQACAELITTSFHRSFFGKTNVPIGLATARAGNLVGGGDWSDGRLVPDIVRSILNDQPIQLRNPASIRAWQHVLEALSGCLQLGASLLTNHDSCSRAWNFGPYDADALTVRAFAARVLGCWQSVTIQQEFGPNELHEAQVLKLDSSSARRELGWCPLLSLDERIQWTIDWYKESARNQGSAWSTMTEQIEKYQARWQQRFEQASTDAIRSIPSTSARLRVA
jgi:CDP-glucose 4,6-dehydratase